MLCIYVQNESFTNAMNSEIQIKFLLSRDEHIHRAAYAIKMSVHPSVTLCIETSVHEQSKLNCMQSSTYRSPNIELTSYLYTTHV